MIRKLATYYSDMSHKLCDNKIAYVRNVNNAKIREKTNFPRILVLFTLRTKKFYYFFIKACLILFYVRFLFSLSLHHLHYRPRRNVP